MSDNCSISSVINDYNNTSTLVGAVFALGTTTVVWTITDTSGNTENCSYDVVVEDHQAPVIITCPNDITVNTDPSSCAAIVSWALPEIQENCPSTLVWSNSHNPGDAFNSGVTTVSHVITDSQGNSVSCTFTITVIDNEPPATPTLTDLTAQCSITVTPPTATDNCGGMITGTTGENLTISAQGTTEIYWTFDDGTSSIVVLQNVIITDTQAPVISSSLPDVNITGCEIASISELTIPTAPDDCDGPVSGTLEDITFPFSTPGTTTFTWTYTDAVGNISTQNQEVILTSPSIDGGVLLGELSAGGTGPESEINITSCAGETNTIDMTLSGETGTIIQWEKFSAGDSSWEIITNTTNTHNVTFNSTNSESTYYKVLVQEGTCANYSTLFYVRAVPPDIPPLLDPYDDTFCLGEELTLVARSNFVQQEDAIVGSGGDFQTGQFPDKFNEDMWRIDGEAAAAHWTANANSTDKPTNWAGTNPHVFGSTIWYDSGSPKFGIAHGDYYSDWIKKKQPQVFEGETTLETPIFDLSNVTSASLEFDQAYNLVAGDYLKLEISIDGGDTYTTVLQSFTGPITWDYNHPRNNTSDASNYNFDTDNSSWDLSAFFGESEVRAKWTFHGTSPDSVWAVDGIAIPIVPVLNQLEWTDGIGDPDTPPIDYGQLEATFTYVPDAPGFHQYGATALVEGCRSYDAAGTIIADVYVNYSYAGPDQIFSNGECGENSIQLTAYDNRLTATENQTRGAFTNPTDCFNCDDSGTMEEGAWSISENSSCGGGSFSDITDPDAIFIGEAGTYTLSWTVDGCSDDMEVVITNCSTIDFDGTDDYVDFKKENYELNGAFSVEVWVKPESLSGGDKTILSKRVFNSSTKGYDLSLDSSGIVSFNWNESGSIKSPYSIGTDRWYHIAVTHSGTQYSLYIDGIRVALTGGGSPGVNSYKCILGAMDHPGQNKLKKHFNGWIDELRIWDVELTAEHIHQNMNQEIQPNPADNSQVFGEVVLMEVHGLAWANLIGYYRMDEFACGDLQSNLGVGTNGKLKYITTEEPQTAPLPYTSRADQTWTTDNTWTNFQVWDPPNSDGVDGTPIDWNIVQVDHNIRGNKDITVLGLFSNSGELTINNTTSENEDNSGHMLWVTHYLKLNGEIDLVGESQLLQKPYWSAQYYESMLDESSIGSIERDQQGIMNSYAYNYWSSPVSLQGVGNNNPVTINGILKDGSNSSSPSAINFGGNDDPYYADGAISSPIKVAGRWIWKLVNKGNDYANWEFLGKDAGTIRPTEGYTMKGVDGAGSPDLNVAHQNYVYKGKPNNVPFGIAGTPLIHTTFTAPSNPLYPYISLTGNPFPSALDGDQFLLDNATSTDMTLYFWEHWSSGTHQWALYQGGYAIRKINNGVPAVTHPHVSTGGSSRSIPGKYVPVGQGFYVISDADGGSVEFKNSQRFFHRETENGGSNSIFIRGTNNKKKPVEPTESLPEDEIMRIRLGLESPEGFHRQILAAFFEGATDEIDPLYDGKAGDFLRNDGFFLQEDKYFVIQAFGEFNKEREIPLSIFIDEKFTGGIQKFMIDKLENIPDDVDIYIKDYHNDGETYNIRNNNNFEISLEAGEHKDRFALVFQSRLSTLEEIATISDGVTIFMNNSINEIVVQKNAELDFKQITLFNYIGQTMNTWNKGMEERYFSLAAGQVSTGVYILKIDTEQGVISKKLIIK